jgi:hypothetical protein
MAKQPIKKKKFDINSFKESKGLNVTKTNMVVSAADKPQDFIVMPEAFVEATKLPGIPMGVTTIIHGHSNTGKSLLKNCLIASAQKQGILPVIIETENNFSFPFAIDCGVDAEPVYGDVEVEETDIETGEITTHTENRIINYTGNFMYDDSEILVEKYGNFDHAQGKPVSKKRTVPVIEDVAMLVNELLTDQEEGRLPVPLLFVWDSVGSIPSFASLMSSRSNSMWDAKALQESFNILLNNKIPCSKKISSPYTNTFVAVNKIWLDSMSAPMAAPSVQLKGGNALLYASRLTILLGGSIKAATQKLTATSKGEKYTYGLKTKIKVVKNQLDSPYNLTYEGTFCCVPDGMVSENKLDDYKKEHIGKILKQLSQQLSEGGKEAEVTEEDVQFGEEDGED